MTTSNKKITQQGLKSCSAQVIPAGSIILSSRAPIGYVAIATIDCCTNQGCKSFNLKQSYDSEFIYYNLKFNVDKIKNLGEGTTFAEISKTALAKVQIAFLENREEQTQIAAILSTIDRAIEQTEAIIAKQQRIKTGLMQDLLTKGIDEDGNVRSEETHEFKDSPLGRIPVEWEAKTIGGILNEYGGKLQTGPFGSQLHASEYVAEGIPFVMPQDIQDADISEDDIAYITEERANDLIRHRMQTGDIVFARRGDLSRCAVVKEYQKGWVCGSGCFLMKPPEKFISPKWITEVYRYHATQVQVSVQAVGSTMVNLNRGILASLCIPFPTYREQIQIEARLKDVEKEKTILFQQFSKFKQTKTGLMQDLLTGKVRVTELLKDSAAASP